MICIIISVLILVVGITLCCAGGCSCDGDDKFLLAFLGIIFIVCSLLIYSLELHTELSGYPADFNNLPVYGVGEVVYTEPAADSQNTWLTLIRLPNSELRLFALPSQPEIGSVKVQPDRSLKPYPATNQPATEK